MATLMSLPNELLCIICSYLYPPTQRSRDANLEHAERVQALYRLSLANHRLLSVVEPILYSRSVKHHFASPLAWAGKFGYAGTLHKVLAAGVSPDRKLRSQVTRKFWHLANDTRQATLDWVARDPKYWPAFTADRLLEFDGDDEARAREMSPGLTHFDVIDPARTCPSTEPGDTSSDLDGFTPDMILDRLGWATDAARGVRLPPEAYETNEYLLREYTALHLAAADGHTDLINLLLANGASVDSSSRWLCACSQPRGLWQTFLDRPMFGRPNPVDWPPVHAAFCSSRIEAAKILIAASKEVAGDYHNGPAGYGPLHQAAAAGHADLVGYILDTHPELDVDVPDDLGMTPFYYAYINARWNSTVPLLLARGAKIDSPFRVVSHRPPLHQRVCLRVTPLTEACRFGRFEDAMKLIDFGADVSSGIRLRGHPATNEIPLLHLCCMIFTGDDMSFSPELAIWRQAPSQRAFRAAVIARLVAAGTSPDEKWGFGGRREETALSVAVRHINVSAVEALLAAGADVGARDSRGRNALMVFVEKRTGDSPSEISLGCLERVPQRPGSPAPDAPEIAHPDKWIITKLLIDAGTCITDGDADGNTVLHLLFERLNSSDGWVEPRSDIHILQFLLARGADPCLRNKEGDSPLHVAVRNKRVSAVESIARQGRIDLVKTFSMLEVVALFDAVPVGFATGNRFIEPLWDTPVGDSYLLDVDTRQLLNALVDMDRSGRLLSDVSFICSRLRDFYNRRAGLELAEILCFRGLGAGSFDLQGKLTMLRAAIKVGRWEMARTLLQDVPDADIDLPDSDGHTLLSLVTSSHWTNGAEFAWQLIERGADIHSRVPAALPSGGDTTPLKQALLRPTKYPIERMVQKQPIGGNPRAIEHYYLHWAVTFTSHPDLRNDQVGVMWSARDMIVRALLAAGADPAQRDSNDDTPLSKAVEEMYDSMYEVLWDTWHWLKPLCNGVDVHRENKQGLSIVHRLNSILERCSDAAMYGPLRDLVERVRPENGEVGKMEIRWPQSWMRV